MAAPSYKILGKGTYGAVVAPALPNIDACGNPVHFGDGFVTKIMFKESSYSRALDAINKIARNVPTLAQNIQPYRRTITNTNIAPIPGMTEYVDKSHPHHTRVYALRMPHLGSSLHDIMNDTTEGPTNMRRRLRSWSNKEICGQVLKLMRIVRDIYAAGYIHADIRAPNIMCNLDTKDFTITDFDWFTSFNDFIRRYPDYFYSHPPEGMYVLDHTNHIEDIQPLFTDYERPDAGEYRKTLNSNISIWLNKYKTDIDLVITSGVKPTIPDRAKFAELLESQGMYLYNLVGLHGLVKGHKLFRNKYIATVDSYGLAYTLRQLLKMVLIEPHQLELRTFLVDRLLPAMLDFRVERRWKMNDAIAAFEEFLEKHMPTVAADLSLEDEIQRLRAISPDVVEVPMPRQRRLSSARRSNLRKQVEGYAALVGALEGIRLPSTSPMLSGLLPMMHSPSGRTASSSAKSHRKTASANKKKSNASSRSTRKKSPK